MGNDIRLSPKHGVNPSVMKCPVCAEDTGLALLGRLRDDAEAPRQMLDRDPCDKCKERFNDYRNTGFTVFVIDDAYENHRERATPWQFFKSAHVLKREAANSIFKDTSAGACFINLSLAKQIGLEEVRNSDKRKN